ncbi:DUF1660 family phage protein [Gaetbulibacter aestuarii]|uniref:DUF1660 family phage protein n=1 Tax=Gaetbulibacter aestuarii TaxID=1502358 RepID=A0ABW7MVR2_9FLAO
MGNLNCKMFGHQLEVTREVTYHVKEYTCKRCRKQYTTNSNGNLVELSQKFKEINDVLERIHQNRAANRIRVKAKAPENLLVFSH